MKSNKISDLSERFLQVLECKKISGYQLSKEVEEITQPKLTFIRNGTNQPSKKLIEALLKKFTDVSKVWLLTGEGSMLKDSNTIK